MRHLLTLPSPSPSGHPAFPLLTDPKSAGLLAVVIILTLVLCLYIVARGK